MSKSPESAGGHAAGPHPEKPDENAQEHSWVEALEEGIEEIKTQSAEVLFVDVLKIDLPYIVMLTMAVIGVGLVTFTGQSIAWYWELLTPVYCVICIYVGWRHAETKNERVKLVWTQILHWAAFLAAMALIYSPAMRALVDVNATGLNLMVILALATFVAGVHAEAWQICVVGLILALFVPGMALIQRDSLFIMVALVGVIFVGASLWLTMHAHRRAAKEAA
ncbi:hypothetical protein OGR47_07905 [Methylocystis sp. MJC1]|jgi:hypothetical protein|uniref:DUF3488 domain-containing protein n=1 Tax=Methylocystis sp. MJC1 TaxID=2654282 RepID=UPI0013EC37BF|nr:hypothetical protein [Methylocystis sp. MJC1]KAF2989186.1 hypothetical protein MJC1_03656 [Methylocystis sp. MJC1]MBU6526915.1 hypothetical protein [Methylocystis sp. MJC1]UZX13351.1 hypothetical protein OGR47_07905 [Methylocystis sp. MJC1]